MRMFAVHPLNPSQHSMREVLFVLFVGSTTQIRKKSIPVGRCGFAKNSKLRIMLETRTLDRY